MKRKSLKELADDIGSATIEMYSNKRVIVIDCKGIIDYSDESISLDIGNKKVRICGSDLIADSFSFGQTDIKGTIKSLEFI